MILKFSAEWCGPCKSLSKILADAEIQYTEVNIDEDPELAAEHKVRNVPTLIYKDGDSEIGRMVGVKPIAAIQDWIQSCEEVVAAL